MQRVRSAVCSSSKIETLLLAFPLQPRFCYLEILWFYFHTNILLPQSMAYYTDRSASHVGIVDRPPWLRFAYVCLFGAQLFASKLPDMRGWLVWDKLAGKTPCSQSDCELAWTNRDKPVRMKTHLWRGIMRDGEENVVHGGKLHPNQKPVSLMRWAIETMAIPRDVRIKWIVVSANGSKIAILAY